MTNMEAKYLETYLASRERTIGWVKSSPSERYVAPDQPATPFSGYVQEKVLNDEDRYSVRSIPPKMTAEYHDGRKEPISHDLHVARRAPKKSSSTRHRGERERAASLDTHILPQPPQLQLYQNGSRFQESRSIISSPLRPEEIRILPPSSESSPTSRRGSNAENPYSRSSSASRHARTASAAPVIPIAPSPMRAAPSRNRSYSHEPTMAYPQPKNPRRASEDGTRGSSSSSSRHRPQAPPPSAPSGIAKSHSAPVHSSYSGMPKQHSNPLSSVNEEQQQQYRTSRRSSRPPNINSTPKKPSRSRRSASVSSHGSEGTYYIVPSPGREQGSKAATPSPSVSSSAAPKRPFLLRLFSMGVKSSAQTDTEDYGGGDPKRSVTPTPQSKRSSPLSPTKKGNNIPTTTRQPPTSPHKSRKLVRRHSTGAGSRPAP